MHASVRHPPDYSRYHHQLSGSNLNNRASLSSAAGLDNISGIDLLLNYHRGNNFCGTRDGVKTTIVLRFEQRWRHAALGEQSGKVIPSSALRVGKNTNISNWMDRAQSGLGKR